MLSSCINEPWNLDLLYHTPPAMLHIQNSLPYNITHTHILAARYHGDIHAAYTNNFSCYVIITRSKVFGQSFLSAIQKHQNNEKVTEDNTVSLPRLSGTDCRNTFVPSSQLTVLKSRWSLTSSPLTAPNWYVSRHCVTGHQPLRWCAPLFCRVTAH